MEVLSQKEQEIWMLLCQERKRGIVEKNQNVRSAKQSEILALLNVSDQGPAVFSRMKILPRG